MNTPLKAESLKVSIIIPTMNGAKTLRELLAMLSIQSWDTFELLVVDSSSKDETLDVAKDGGAEVVTLPRNEYDHGGTRTLLAKKASGDVLVFLTQDAIPATRDSLARIIEPFTKDPSISVSYGRQLPSFSANEFATHLRLFNYPEESYVRSYQDRINHGLRTVFTSNSFAAYRKSTLEEVDYFKNGLIFGEDTCTVGRLLLKGYKVSYVSNAEVYHSHNYSLVEEFNRSFDIGVLHTTENWLLTTYGKAEGEGVRYIFSEVKYLWKKKKADLLPLAFTRIAAKFLGYKLGRNFKKLPKKVVSICSLHKIWWEKNRFP